ncbi:hypothetical protein AGOR_G00052890 [Albula goreensis]|uniref:Ig-like domain-containing protein n=1 Tax=Albula goreensis TaxID=1534307 RepID=A0A8T3DTG6_9TELE|nr:hypothetical protein AGOR_G00052890 [Albula goreensis]
MILGSHVLIFFQLTFLSALGHCFADLIVRQTPESVHVKEGVNVTLNCTITLNTTFIQTFTVITVEWIRTSKIERFKRLNVSEIFTEDQEWTDKLHFHSVQRNQSGIYFCRMTTVVPCVKAGNGTGTHLIIDGSDVKEEVSPSPGTTDKHHLLTILWMSLLAAALLLGLGCVSFYKRKENNRTVSAEAAPACLARDTFQTPNAEVLYAKLNIRNPSGPGRSNKKQAQNSNEPQFGKKTRDSRCFSPAAEEHVLYSTLKTAAPGV